MNSSFAEAFKALTGESSPFPWQERLYERFVANNFPDCLDIPTGLGKASVMAIWLLAREQNPSLPSRLVYVVNRRTIVDQASDIAKDFAAKFDNLAVSTLRGARADNRAWMRSPHQPAIVIGTVDMIGSRLLFDAYRAGKWTKAMHAGLLAQDSLIIHDESHLSQPFQMLLTWIARRQSKDRSPKPLRVIAMSATDAANAERPHKLGDEDRALDIVQKRIHSKKRLRVHPFDAKDKLVDRMAELAFSYEGEGELANRIILFVRTPAMAQKIAARLQSHHKVDEERIALLTGTIRGQERDRLAESLPVDSLLNPKKKLQKTIYLVSTSAGEVGADFDADQLICDISTLDSMIQRLGRVNRRGEGDAMIDVFVDLKVAKRDLDERMLRTADWLNSLPLFVDDPDGRRDASPAALTNMRESDLTRYMDAISLSPAWTEPHPATLDAWAFTSVHDPWPIAPPLDDYLHGQKDPDRRTSLAWRDELSVFFPPLPLPETPAPTYDPDKRERQFRKWIALCPVRPREVVTDKTERVMYLLRALAAKTKGQYAGHMLIRLDRGDAKFNRLGEFINQFDAMGPQSQARFLQGLANQTILLPSEVGGLSDKGMIEEGANGVVPDVADRILDETEERDESLQSEQRVRIWLARDADDGMLTSIWFGGMAALPHDLPVPINPTKWTSWRDGSLSTDPALAGLKPVPFLRLDNDDGTGGVLLLYKARPKQANTNTRVFLIDHNSATQTKAEEFIKDLVDRSLHEPILLAAGSHDLGKACERWQRSIGNEPPAEALAKSCGKGLNVEGLDGYRHEFGSLIELTDATKPFAYEFNKLKDEDARDVALHLIAAHHGRGRPFFPQGAIDPNRPALTDFGKAFSPGAIARRYARLQLRFGHWGLAWLESLLMCADHATSRDVPEDSE